MPWFFAFFAACPRAFQLILQLPKLIVIAFFNLIPALFHGRIHGIRHRFPLRLQHAQTLFLFLSKRLLLFFNSASSTTACLASSRNVFTSVIACAISPLPVFVFL